MLLLVAIEGMKRQYAKMLEELKPLEKGSHARIVPLGRAHTRFSAKESGIFRLMFGLSKDHDASDGLVEKGGSVFSLVQQVCAYCRCSDSIEDIDMHRAFLLWSFVHGLSFLQIDDKLSKMNVASGIEDILAEIAVRVMADGPNQNTDSLGCA